MVDRLIVLNGVPGAGKTTLARPLAELLGARLIQKDAIKEALWDAVGGGLPTSALGAIAAETLWRLAALHDGAVVVESFWRSGRDDRWFEEGYAAVGSPPGVEIWCSVPLHLAIERFRTRPRHPAHDDASRLDEMRLLVADAEPVSGLPVIRIDTAGSVDVTGLASEVRRRLDAAIGVARRRTPG